MKNNDCVQEIDPVLLDRVIEFVKKRRGKTLELCAETRLFHDLGIDGDDADYFLVEFSDEFNVDLSNNQSFYEHFGPELTLAILLPWMWRTWNGPRNKDGQVMKIPITLGDLAIAAKIEL